MKYETIITDSGVSFDNYTSGSSKLKSQKCKVEYFSNKNNPIWYVIVLLLVVVLIIWLA